VAREQRDVGRYEWEQIILRARLNGVIPAEKNRGAVSGTTFRAVALTWASHADGLTGGDMFPGDATLAVEAETSLKTVKAVKAKLIELGLVRRTATGARRAHGRDTWQLTLPTDLLDLLEVLTPAAVKVAAGRIADTNRRSRTGSTGPHTGEAVQGPPDSTHDAANTDEQGPQDPTQAAPAEIQKGSSGPANDARKGSSGPAESSPLDRYTNQDHPPTTNQPANEARTTVTLSRASPHTRSVITKPDPALAARLARYLEPKTESVA
jgi:hypothetical protein